ncbi:hypothetical protein TGP89_215920 [Toxoplasma gondii p89]|uniref:Uncharacterized protein n=1 Tax=Toxoplasma gondii p89 TaxID=943119 RepID=A0A086JI61_TOXGO|nr:hypothetical protein TGP89_215920 [Toxoplasma gondii p89]
MAASARRLSSLTRDAHKRFVPPSSSLFPLSPPVSAASPLPSFSSFFSPSRGSLPSSSTLASPPRPSSSLPSFSLSSSSPPSSSPPSSSLSLFASFFSLRFPSHAFSSLRKTKTETESGGEDDEQRAEKECSRSAFSSTLPPESHTRIAAIHKKLMTSPVVCAPLSEETKRACFPPLPEESFWRQRFDQIKDVLFLNDTLRHRGRLLLSSILPLYGDMNLLKTYFGIEEGSLSARLYFLVLHVWLLHRRLVALVRIASAAERTVQGGSTSSPFSSGALWSFLFLCVAFPSSRTLPAVFRTFPVIRGSVSCFRVASHGERLAGRGLPRLRLQIFRGRFPPRRSRFWSFIVGVCVRSKRN